MKLPRITEAAFLRQVLDLAKLHGWRSAHFRPAKTAKGWRTAVQGDGVGFPDLILLRGERMIVLELKRDRRAKTTPEQDAWLAAFIGLGCENVMVAIVSPEHWAWLERVLR